MEKRKIYEASKGGKVTKLCTYTNRYGAQKEGVEQLFVH